MTLEPRLVDLAAVLNAHPFLRVERPPVIWQPNVNDEPFIRMLGELIVAALTRNGGILGDVILNVSNVVVEPEAGGPMPVGAFVAITIRGRGDWRPEVARQPHAGDTPRLPHVVSEDVEAAAAVAGAAWAYTRQLGADEGSVTVFFRRLA